MYDVLILYSGGADSRLMLELALQLKKYIHCVLIDYGQMHKKELEVASTNLEIMIKNGDLGLSYQTVSIGNLKVNSGLTGNNIDGQYEGVHEKHVPGRNSIFLSIAFSIAEANNIPLIWIGCDYSDRLNLFPDCYQEYIVKFNEMLKYAGPKEIKVEAPLMGMTKEFILELLENNGITKKDLYSGYGEYNGN